MAAVTAFRSAVILTVGLSLVTAACEGGDGDEETATSAAGGHRGPLPTFPATPLPEARTEVAGALWITTERIVIAVAGGYTADGLPSSRLDVLDESGVWTRGPDLPAAYDHTSLVTFEGRLWLVGGNADGRPTRDVFSLGRDDQWREEARLRVPRAALATVAANGRLVAIGGANDDGVLASTEIYDPDAGEWQAGPGLDVPREHTAAAVVGNTAYAIGGRQLSLKTNLTSVESLTLPDGKWRPEADLNFSRGGIAAASVPDGPCVAGGEEPEGTIASVECLVDDEWGVVATLAVPRHGLAMIASGRLHVLGGGPQPGLTVSDTHEVFTV